MKVDDMHRKIAPLIVLLFVVCLGTLPALGQESTILLKSQEVINQFPEGITFQAVAETAAPEQIQEIKLELKIKGSSRSSYAYLEFDPATLVQGKYLLRTGGAQYKPPGSLMEYRFIIKDSAGRTLETDKETYLYMDNRFQWEKISEGPVELYYYGPIKGRAEILLKAGTDTVTRIGAMLGIAPAQPIRVIGYNNPTHMASALPFQAKAVEAELVTQGQAWYEYGLLLLLAGDPRADGVVCHELTHMLVSEATKGVPINLPAWLNEGLAEYANINPGYAYDEFLSEAISSGSLLRVRHMQAMPGTPQKILLAYGEARSVVRYLADTYGDSKIGALFAAFKQGLQIDEALMRVYGFDQDGLDNAWRQSLGLPPIEPDKKEQESTGTAKRWGFGCSGPTAALPFR